MLKRSPSGPCAFTGKIAVMVFVASVIFAPVNAATSGKMPRKAAVKIPAAVLPSQFIAARAQRILADLKSRPLRPAGFSGELIGIAASPSKNSWLEAVYNKNLIEASWASQMLSDKRLFAAVLEIELGAKFTGFYPKTLGLREFLSRHRMVNADGEITASGDEIEEALSGEFPAGFVVRPAVGIAPQETGRGLFPDTDQFIMRIMETGNPVFHPAHMSHPVR